MHMGEEFHEVALEHPSRLIFVGNEKPAHDLGNINNFRLAIKRLLRSGFGHWRFGYAGLGPLDPGEQSVALIKDELEQKSGPG